MRRRDDAEFTEFALATARRMRRTAYLMCGDWHRAEDATQDALVKVYRRWGHLQRDGRLVSYANHAVVSAVLDQSRRRWRSEVVGGVERADTASPDATLIVDDRSVVIQAMSKLPAGQRSCLVLRFYVDLSVEQTAEILGTSTSTVRSQTSRGIAHLRNLLATPERSSK
ncbi:SigE family RNA polymerase sigma factor [Kribbella albertanoniae]|uniref:SigE family RNA polymerase sigma factor n=1 Tax=Kribbella albertanoniae TaxID=1266829 RepID=A0A4R4QEM2_9ACTN|nr:SigE family RNA polymerase sigma factor [Kribbella albertanoniae]TDC34051.1 SigE family RNA polymerase sigma factor [Kribbella albertanoniae]